MCTTIWADTEETLETIFDHVKLNARSFAAEAVDDGIADTDWLTGVVIRQAWVDAGGEFAPITPGLLRARIDTVDMDDVINALTESNRYALQDQITMLDAITLDSPVVVDGVAGRWDGDMPVRSVIHPATVGDILRTAPWRGMDAESWDVDDDDNLRYTGIHHDGTNTATFRVKRGRKTTPLGPVIRETLGL